MNWYQMLITASSWGKGGAGVLFVCEDDHTAMLLLRSSSVYDPNVWGVPGGAILGTDGHHGDDSTGGRFSKKLVWQTAVTETMQECGYFPRQYRRDPQPVVFEKPNSNFKYWTYLVHIPLAEKRKLDAAFHHIQSEQPAGDQTGSGWWENTDIRWYPVQDLMRYMHLPSAHPLHPANDGLHHGVEYVVNNHPYFQQQTQNPPEEPPV
jgi:8-oxo-dGTP pyrophosphatase MutT (NUDIX family)